MEPPPSLLSLVLSIMIMGFRDREVIAVNPVLSKQKHKCHSATIADTPAASYYKNFMNIKNFSFVKQSFVHSHWAHKENWSQLA